MTAKLVKSIALLTLAALAASCGEFTREGRAPAIVVVRSLEGASGATPDELGGTLDSDVVTNVTRPAPCSEESPCPTIFPDVAEVQLTLVPKNPGIGSGPSELNSVTINRYRVEYQRTDGRNNLGVDVPYPFDSALTVTVPNDGVVTAGFELVRHAAKLEAPLKALRDGGFLSTIAQVTFYGRDQAGNEVTVSSQIGIHFGNFADPQ